MSQELRLQSLTYLDLLAGFLRIEAFTTDSGVKGPRLPKCRGREGGLEVSGPRF